MFVLLAPEPGSAALSAEFLDGSLPENAFNPFVVLSNHHWDRIVDLTVNPTS
jgi:hypothetical protein